MSKIKHYETMFILKPTLTEEETVAQIEAIKAIIEKMVEKLQRLKISELEN